MSRVSPLPPGIACRRLLSDEAGRSPSVIAPEQTGHRHLALVAAAPRAADAPVAYTGEPVDTWSAIHPVNVAERGIPFRRADFPWWPLGGKRRGTAQGAAIAFDGVGSSPGDPAPAPPGDHPGGGPSRLDPPPNLRLGDEWRPSWSPAERVATPR